MSVQSTHLDRIIEEREGTANLQVVFVDIEKYSRRKTVCQNRVIKYFTKCFNHSVAQIVGKYEKTHPDLMKDLIQIPTGDGAVIVFSYDGLLSVHLQFAMVLLKSVAKLNESNPCPIFTANGWCNCHPNFNLRIGISEGKGIVYRDINNNYNVAGNVINMASRVMGKVETNQIAFTEESYRQLVDMVTEGNLSEKFACLSNVEIKHGEKLNIYLYVDESYPFLNCTVPDGYKFLKDTAGSVGSFFKNIAKNTASKMEGGSVDGFMGKFFKGKKEEPENPDTDIE